MNGHQQYSHLIKVIIMHSNNLFNEHKLRNNSASINSIWSNTDVFEEITQSFSCVYASVHDAGLCLFYIFKRSLVLVSLKCPKIKCWDWRWIESQLKASLGNSSKTAYPEWSWNWAKLTQACGSGLTRSCKHLYTVHQLL